MRRDPLGPEEVDPAIGRRLRGIRQEQRKTVKQVAQFLDVSVDTVSLVENGKMAFFVNRLILWCFYLGVDPGDVLKQALDDVSEGEAANG